MVEENVKGTGIGSGQAADVRKGLQTRTLADVGTVEVWLTTKWWGFELHLNQAGVDALVQIQDLIAKVMEEVFFPEFSEIIAIAVEVKDKWIKAVSHGNGCKMVSPWVAPTMLIPVTDTPKDDKSLWWAVFDNTDGWGDDTQFTETFSANGPSLAEHDGLLYCAHRGAADDSLWWTVYRPDTGWSEDRIFPHHYSATTPTLVEFNGVLYCFHRGHGSDTRLWYCTLSADGTTWNPDINIAGESSPAGVAAAVFNGRLHLMYESSEGKQQIIHISTSDGHTWSAPSALPDHKTATVPALAVYHGKLHLVHRGAGDDTKLYHATSADGVSWTPDLALPHHLSLGGPALAVYADLLCMVHRGNTKDDNLWYATYNDTTWNTDTEFPNHHSADTPALVDYRDPNATTTNYRDPTTTSHQLLMVHRGGNKT